MQALTSTLTAPARPVGRAAIRAAATLVVVRDAGPGIEVLLSRRAENGDLNSGAWVFPGGVVDAGDRAAHGVCIGLDDAAASAALGIDSGGLDYFIAALRECFEESGLLYAVDGAGRPVALDDAAGQQLVPWRKLLHRGERSLADLCAQTGVRLDVGRLAYLSHWLTPPGRHKRFDTRFFIAVAPAGQSAEFDGTEMLEQLWLRPAAALARSEELRLMTPTRKTLELLAPFDAAAAGVTALLDWARTPRAVPLVMPRLGNGRPGRRPVTPDEPAWAEIGRLDPEGHGDVHYDIQPGVPVRLSPHVIRVTAANGSVMTGPGTNAYLIGGGPANTWALLDPGPLDAAHTAAILAAAPGPIRWIFATHTHADHSPGAVALQAATGAPVLGRLPAHPEWQDASFAPTQRLQGGERFALDAGVTLHAIHTPGHASNHLCYLLEEEKTLFTGDHVMQLSTVVINPPDGDMAAYIASLRSLLALDLDWLAPGHGFLMPQPRAAMEAVIRHRLKREAKVIEALRELGPAPIEALLARVYDDVPQRLHGVALRSLRAHLLKLRDEGLAGEGESGWALNAL